MTATITGLVDHLPDTAAVLEEHATRFRHRLTGSGMFEDGNLFRIIDSHPRGFYDVYSDRSGDLSHREVNADSATRRRESAALLQAVNEGGASLVIRDVMRFQPGLQRLVERLYTELQDKLPGFDPRRLSADLIVAHSAAPIGELFCDAPGILWQVRGRQRLSCSSTTAGDGRLDLNPGVALAFPLRAGPGLETVAGLSVSLCTGHHTPRQLRGARVLRANQLLRNSLKLPCRSTQTAGLVYTAKSSVYFAWQAVQRLRPRFAKT